MNASNPRVSLTFISTLYFLIMSLKYHLTMSVIVFITITTLFVVDASRDYVGLPRGPYCANRYEAGACCVGRQDECSAPILRTLCYCDNFCNRTNEDDCCPDYWSHCMGITLPTESPLEELRQCYFKGKYYEHGDTFRINCNNCKCSSMGRRAEVLCEKNRCLIEDDLLKELKYDEEYLGWQSTNKTEFWGKTLDEGIQYRLGTLNLSQSVYKMTPVRKTYNPDSLPRQFDSRLKWPHLISGVQNQGWCGSSWAISTVDVASDRFALMSKGAEAVKLSAQQLISCNNRGQQGCNGGYVDKAWMFIRKFGLVESHCYQWTNENSKCKLRKRTNLIEAFCPPKNPLRKELYRVGPAYRLGNETDIMQEIITSGPVQATMRVYQDFFVYESGVYRHSKIAENYRSGHHSVRIVGWGEELIGNNPPVKYWIVANSWGPGWGENGFFRIQRGTNECNIESFVLGVWAKVSTVELI